MSVKPGLNVILNCDICGLHAQIPFNWIDGDAVQFDGVNSCECGRMVCDGCYCQYEPEDPEAPDDASPLYEWCCQACNPELNDNDNNCN